MSLTDSGHTTDRPAGLIGWLATVLGIAILLWRVLATALRLRAAGQRSAPDRGTAPKSTHSMAGTDQRGAEPANRIRHELEQLFRTNPGREFTFQSLFLKANPPSSELLAVVLDDLARGGKVRRVFRVESPTTHVGLGDFASIVDIPEVIRDEAAEADVEVRPDFIRPIFKTQRA
jgi:hypothetical protein